MGSKIGSNIAKGFTGTFSDNRSYLGNEFADGSAIETKIDISTITYTSSSIDITGKETDNHAIQFNEDKTKLFIGGEVSGDVHEYSLSIGGDFNSTATFIRTLDVSLLSPAETNGFSFRFKPDGKALYIYGWDNGLTKYPISTAWDLTSVGTGTIIFDGGLVLSFDISKDGLNFVYNVFNSSTMRQRTFSTPWGTTISGESSTLVHDGLAFSPKYNSNGTQIIGVNETENNFFTYDLPTPYLIGSGINLQTSSLGTNGTTPKAIYIDLVTLDKIYHSDAGTLKEWTTVPIFQFYVNSFIRGEVQIVTNGEGTIYWGDGSSEVYTGTSDVLLHTYTEFTGIVKFIGTLTRIDFSTALISPKYAISDLPRDLTWLKDRYSGITTGTYVELPRTLTYIRMGDQTLLNGNLSDLPDTLTYVNIAGLATADTYISGKTWNSGITFFQLLLIGDTLTSTELDNLFIDLANNCTVGGGIYIGVTPTRTSASDASISTLEGNGYTITIY